MRLLPLLLLASLAFALPSRLQPRALIRGTDTAAEIALNARYAVRWMDPSQGLFGSTFNFTFTQPSLFAQRWAVRFRMADNATQIKEFWGSWQALELVRGWYQITPKQDMRLNDQKQIYFSFNGVWNTTTGDWNTTHLACIALEVQVTEANNIPTVYQLRDSSEFSNEPVPFEIPAAPFGNFIRNAARPGAQVVRMQGSLSTVPLPMPVTNFLGTYIILPMLALFCAALIIATMQSWRWRRVYRMQLAQVQSRQQPFASTAASNYPANGTGIAASTPESNSDEMKVPAGYDNAYAGYYMLLDGAWDHQVVHDGDENPVDAYGRPYSIAPVVTDAYQANKQARANGPRRTTMLVPGKEYRLTLLERGVPMPADWLPPQLQHQHKVLQTQQQRYKLDSSTTVHEVGRSGSPSEFPSTSLPSQDHLPPLPSLQLALNTHDHGYNDVEDPTVVETTGVQSRSIVGARMRRDVIQPSRYIAESVPAVEGAVVYTAAERDTMVPRIASTELEPSQLISNVQPHANGFLQVHQQQSGFEMIPLSPGWPICDEEESAYSPSMTDRDQPLQQVPMSVSPPKDKPLPAIGGWNMI